MALIHRFGALLNAHAHFHCVVIEGVFEADGIGGVRFCEAQGVGAATLAQVQAKVRHRYFGVLAPNAPLRSAVTALAGVAAETPAATTVAAPASTAPSVSAERAEEPIHRRAGRYAWVLLPARIYELVGAALAAITT